MARKAQRIVCSNEDLKELKQIINSGKSEQRMVLRAKIIIECCGDGENKEIARHLALVAVTVAKWRNRFLKDGISGLYDSTRSGKPPKYTAKDRNSILKLLEKTPPVGQSTWDGESIANELGLSDDYVWRILRKEGIQLQRKRSWCVSTDPEFAAKSADIIGLYLNPPERAIVLSIDEKPSIQALERKRGYVKTSSKKFVQGLQSTYKRNGTINLFAALNVATGTVTTKTTSTKTRKDFLEFMDDLVEKASADEIIHVILDNYCTHKKNDEWLRLHPNVKFHYTPTSASWLNQIEIWFGILTRKALKNGSFSSTGALIEAINKFTEKYHENAEPFAWKKREVKGSQLRNTLSNLCN